MARQVDIFSNPYFEAFSSAGQGAMQGAQYGPKGAVIGAGVGVAANVASQYANERNQMRDLTKPLPGAEVDQFGRPTYNLGNAISEFQPNQDWGQGITEKASLMAGGAIVGSLLERRLKKKGEEAAEKGRQNIQAAQESFNKYNTNYINNYLARRQYENQF
jgi:hypothetical protein